MSRSSISARALAAIAASCALFCAGAASASAAPLAFVAGANSASVSAIDTGTHEVVAGPIAVGEDPFSIAITPDARFAYVANQAGESVSVIETATRKAVGKPITVGVQPVAVAVSPDGKSVYVADETSNEVSVIGTATKEVVATIEVGLEPDGVAFTPDGKFAYVASQGTGTVEVIDTQTGQAVGAPIPVGGAPKGIALTPDGKTAYVTVENGDEVAAIATADGHVTPIPVGGRPSSVAVTPDGRKAFVTDQGSDAVSVIDTALNQVVDTIDVGEEPAEIAITPDGKTAYVAEVKSEDVRTIDTRTDEVVGKPIHVAGGPWRIAITPDQSPTAAFAVPDVTAGLPATFSGAASSDPDGTIASYSWAFGDGGTATGVSPSHTYAAPGAYEARLSAVDDEGCGEAEVFTGRTAYCSGAPPAVHQVVAKAPAAVEPIAAPPSNRFRFGRVLHNRRNGTVRLQVKLPGAGYIFLFGKKVHAVTRKPKAAGSMWLTLHARVELNKRLKKIHRAPVRIRVTFTPNGGTPKTLHRSVALLRAPRNTHAAGGSVMRSGLPNGSRSAQSVP